MARSYGKLLTDLFAPESDFRTVPSDGQRLYMALISQNALSPAGCITLSYRKWSQWAPDTTIDDVERAAGQLVDLRYVLIDDDTEEALLRTFIRHDGGWKNGNMRKSIVAAIARIESSALRAVAAAELNALLTNQQAEDPDPHRPEGHHEDPCQWGGEPNSSEQQAPSNDHPAASSGPACALPDPRPVAAAALDLFIDWRIAQGDVHNPGGLRKRVIADDAERVNDYLALHPYASALDVAVDIHGMARPRPQLATRTESCETPCDACEATGEITSRKTGETMQCAWCEGKGFRVVTYTRQVAL